MTTFKNIINFESSFFESDETMKKLLSVVSLSFLTSSAFADAPAAQPPGTMAMLVPFIAMFGVMYFIMIRPQQKKMREQQALLSSIQAGDEVITMSGIYGKVKSVEEKTVSIEVDRGVSLKVVKSQIIQKTTGASAPTVS